MQLHRLRIECRSSYTPDHPMHCPPDARTPINQFTCDVMWTDSPSPPSPHHHTHTCPPTTTHLPPTTTQLPNTSAVRLFRGCQWTLSRGSEICKMGMSFFTMLPHVKGDNGMQRLHVIALLKWNMYTHNFFCCIISGIGLWMKRWTAVEDDEVLDESN